MPNASPPTSEIPAYERYPYRTEHQAEVLHLGEDETGLFAVLDDTILYPEGGGQPADHGRIDDVAVIEVRRVDGLIHHYVDAAVGLGPVLVRLDWERRFDHMQQHTAQHLITAIAAGSFGWETTAFHLGAHDCDIELDVAAADEASLSHLEERVAQIVRQALPVTARRIERAELEASGARSRGLRDDHTGSVRLVEVEGVDRNTCGGTHVASTAEIETVKLLGTESLRGGTRLRWIAGGRVRRRLAAMGTRTRSLRLLFETSEDELLEEATAKLDRLGELRKRARLLERQLAAEAANALAAGAGAIVDRHFDDTDGRFLSDVARHLTDLLGDRTALLTARDAGGTAYFAIVTGENAGGDLEKVGKRVAQLLDGRGGGRSGIYQGRAGSLAERARALRSLGETVENGG